MKDSLVTQIYNLTTSLSFELQPIINAENLEICDYEFLLRSKNNNSFPLKEFTLLTKNNESNLIFMAWLKKKLLVELRKTPTKTISINLDPQQLLYPSTKKFLQELASYQSQLIIEITEQIPLITEQNFVLDKFLPQLYKFGYKLAFDDLGSGQNTLELLLNDLIYFKRIKLSLLKFQQLDADLLAELLNFCQMLAKKEHLELVIEGIDCARKAELALNHGIFLQQGFWWRDLINNHQLNQLNNLDK
ncbi:EAL domain-containing protein [Liquorilactobacillus nagelii]|jgi:EAL domain-containing protein (putative c-di-GMP-specific phosphodiesterase class I)|uniref:EAL domain-containing protein n=1 Tax=Liquorilactobacillus nagelii TaxID=82688 RepID=UPI00242AE46D|nr:EAL domain-containing protein [Liquorilactobacillus nagelii]MCI1698963.1 EAL domain-containing protein [Liquorilactobacillus nagelii]